MQATLRIFCLQSECRSRQWVIEPSDDRFVYVRLTGAYLRLHNAEQHIISNSSIKTSFPAYCSTNARFILTNGEGLSVTACPYSDNSADSNSVGIFSSGWHKFNQFAELHPIRSISVEFLNTDEDEEEYSFTWFELVPKVSMGLVGKFQFQGYLFYAIALVKAFRKMADVTPADLKTMHFSLFSGKLRIYVS